MNLYLIHAGLAAVAFLMVLGMLLGGTRRVQISVVAGAAWVGLLAIAWSEWGRAAGAIAAGMSLLYAAVSLPLAGPAARSLFGLEPEEGGGSAPVPSESLRRISQALAAEGAHGEAAEVLLDWCRADPTVPASRQTLVDLLEWLWAAGANRWVGEHHLAASALAYPPALNLLLTADPGARDQVLARIAAHLEYGAPL